eukprot:scaffold22642_cov134-Cylindrotheca_fusiformis.AAC.14
MQNPASLNDESSANWFSDLLMGPAMDGFWFQGYAICSATMITEEEAAAAPTAAAAVAATIATKASATHRPLRIYCVIILMFVDPRCALRARRAAFRLRTSLMGGSPWSFANWSVPRDGQLMQWRKRLLMAIWRLAASYVNRGA